MRRFIVIGQKATASPGFSLIDLPGTSGRLDVLVRCLRAALLVSHGLRRDTVVYLVLLGGPSAPRAVRVDGATARFVRPDERSLATLLMKALASHEAARPAATAAPDAGDEGLGAPSEGGRFVEMRPGVAVAEGGLEVVLADLGSATPYLLDERGSDIRGCRLDLAEGVFFLGDHLGFDDTTRARLGSLGAATVGLGPVAIHAEDAITVLCNELDRRQASAEGAPLAAPAKPDGE